MNTCMKKITKTNFGSEMVILSVLLISIRSSCGADMFSQIGINYGRFGNNLPTPSRSIELLQTMKARSVKLYDADPEILNLLEGTKLQVSIIIPNNDISNIASNERAADEWVENNLIPYYPNTCIRFVLVGNEVLSYNSQQDRPLWNDLVTAMRKIRRSLKDRSINNIKVGTPLAMDVLQSSFPPSSAIFRPDITKSVMLPLLHFLNQTNSIFFIDVYPYFSWSSNPYDISLDFALLRDNFGITDSGSGLTYTNLLDQMLDSIVFAMTKLGFPNIRLAISETGWPSSGDTDQAGANIFNAATYNGNLINKITASPPIGTPLRPGVEIPTFLFSLYDENQKTGPSTERHWSLFHANETPVYEIDLTGSRGENEFAPLPVALNNIPFRGKLWCVAAAGSNLAELGNALSHICGQGNGMCDALAPGKQCYRPLSLAQHASYAFSSYYAQFRSQGAACYFDGIAELTTKNPSRGSCRFPSVSL